MANSNRPSGLSPVQYLNGTPWNGQAREYFIASGDTNAYSIGDPVDLSGSADAFGVPGITLALPGNNTGVNKILGAIVSAGGVQRGGPYADPSNLNTTVVPATKTKGYYVAVADDPNILFEMQEGGTNPALAAAQVGLNIDLASGANSGYLSGWQIDNAVTSTSANFQMNLFGLIQKADNAFGQYAKWLVKINLHRRAASVSGL